MKRLYVLLVSTLALAACGDPAVVGDGGHTTIPAATANPNEPVDDGADEPIFEPGPAGSIPEPRPPIDGNIDGEVWISSTDLRIMESFPIQVMLDVSGEKPTPCHEVFWTIEDDGEIISIDMISQVASGQVCAEVIEPFNIAVPLGSWEGESRQVTLNGEEAGSFES